MKLLVLPLLVLSVNAFAVSRKSLEGDFKGQTPRGAACTVSLSEPGEFEVSIATTKTNQTARFGTIQFDDQIRKGNNPLRVERMDGHIYEAHTFTAEITLSAQGTPVAASLTDKVRSILGEEKSTRLECRNLAKP